jgi:hypothetical protein
MSYHICGVPSGRYSVVADALTRYPTSCNQCEVGTYSRTGASECITCPEGKFSKGDMSDCVQCYSGQFVNTTLNGCYNCTAGKYTPTALNDLCLTCGAGLGKNTLHTLKSIIDDMYINLVYSSTYSFVYSCNTVFI